MQGEMTCILFCDPDLRFGLFGLLSGVGFQTIIYTCYICTVATRKQRMTKK